MPRPVALMTVLVALLVAIATVVRGDESFIAGIEVLPLMAGLHELRDSTIVFDKPGGRIVEATAIGAVPVADIKSFYLATLPALGWVAAGGLRFIREGEVLILTLDERGEGVRVRYSIAPDHGGDGDPPAPGG